MSVAIHKWWVYRASSALQHYYHCWTCLRHSIIPNIPTSAWIWHWPSHRKLAGNFQTVFWSFPLWIQWTAIGNTPQCHSFMGPSSGSLKIWHHIFLCPLLGLYSYDAPPILVTQYLWVEHQWTGHACHILDMEIQVLDIPNCKKSMDMHNMIISHLICEVNGKAMPTLSKQNTQTDYVANKYMLCGYCWLQSVKVFSFLC